MMYGDPQQQQNQPPPHGGEFQRGPPPPPPQMMRQPSASSSTLNTEYQHRAPPQIPPYDGRIMILNLFCLQFCIFFGHCKILLKNSYLSLEIQRLDDCIPETHLEIDRIRGEFT